MIFLYMSEKLYYFIFNLNLIFNFLAIKLIKEKHDRNN